MFLKLRTYIQDSQHGHLETKAATINLAWNLSPLNLYINRKKIFMETGNQAKMNKKKENYLM